MACDINDLKSIFAKKLRNLNRIFQRRELLDPEDTMRSIRARIISKDNPGLLELFDIVLREQFPKESKSILNDMEIKYEKFLPKMAQISIMQTGDEFSEMHSIANTDPDTVGDSTMEDGGNSTGDLQGHNQFDKKISELGTGAFDDLFNRYTGLEHSKEEMVAIYEKIKRLDSFADFVTWLDEKYDIIGRTQELGKNLDARQRDLLTFYVMHRPVNEIKRNERYELVYLNIDPTHLINDYSSDIPKAVVEGKEGRKVAILQSRPAYDLQNKSDLSAYVAKNFIDETPVKIRGNVKVSRATGYFNLSQSGEVVVYGEDYANDGTTTDAKWYFKPSGTNFTEWELGKLEYNIATMRSTSTGNNIPWVLVAPTPGDTGTFFMSRILNSQANEMFSKEEVIEELLRFGFTSYANQVREIPDNQTILNWFLDKQNIYEAIYRKVTTKLDNGKNQYQEEQEAAGKNWEKNWNNIKNNFEKIELIIQGIGLKAFDRYLGEQVDKGLMTPKQREMQMESANSIENMPRSKNSDGVPYHVVPVTHHISGMVARHEWLQAVRGNDYMLHSDGNFFHLSTRLKINKSMGIVPEGIGSADRIAYDERNPDLKIIHTDREGNETEINQLIDLYDTGELDNKWDGASFNSTERMEEMADRVGASPLLDANGDPVPGEFHPKQIKTVVSEMQLDDEGNFVGYIEKKHAVFEVKPGLKFYDGDNLMFETRLENGKVRIYSGTKQYDSIGDLDAIKTTSGEFNFTGREDPFMTYETQENSERIIITPHYGSNRTVYGYVSYLNSLNYSFEEGSKEGKDFAEFTKALTDLAKNQSGIYVDALIQADLDPRVMRDLLQHIYDTVGERRDSFSDKLRNTLGMGIHHPDFSTQARQMIVNSLLAKGAMQGRTSTDKIGKYNKDALFGSTYIMEPDTLDEVKDDKHVILSSDNKAIYNQILFKILFLNGRKHNKISDSAARIVEDVIYNEMKRAGELDHLKNYELGAKEGESVIGGALMMVDFDNKTHQKILNSDAVLEALNEFLEKNPQKVLTYRAPILHANAVQVRTIQKFVKGEANAVYHHPIDVFLRLVGDHDIDESGVMLIPAKYAEKIEPFYETKFFERISSYNANYDMFETIDGYNVANLKDTKDGWLNVVQGIGIQGMATNMKSIASTLSMRFGKITFSDGTVVSPKKLDDMIVMDYAPLNKDFVKAYNKNKNLLPEGSTIVKKGNEFYLKTTVAHEYLIVVNVATDYSNKKTQGMIFNKWGMTDVSWMIDRTFKVESGSLTKQHYQLLQDLRNKYNYSNTKKLRTPNANKKMNLGLALHHLENLYVSLTAPLEIQAREITKMMQLYVETTGTGIENAIQLGVTDLEMYEVLTPEEEIILNTPRTIFEDYAQGEGGIYPLISPKNRYEVTHHRAKQVMRESYIDKRKYTEDELLEGIRIAEEYSTEFYEVPETMQTIQNNHTADPEDSVKVDDFVKQKRPEWNEEIFKLNNKWSQEIEDAVDKYGEGVREVFTIYMISGIDFRQNIAYLPVLKHGNRFILSPKIHKEYMEIWEQFFFEMDATGESTWREHEAHLKTYRDRRIPNLEAMKDIINKRNIKDC